MADDLDERIAVLDLRRGDVLVLRCRSHITKDIANHIKKDVATILARAGHQDVPVMVVDDSIDLEIIRVKPDAAEAANPN